MRFVRLCLSFALVAPAVVAQADPFGSAISGPFTYGYLTAGLGLPLLRDGALGRERSLRVADSLLTTFGATEGLKALVRERRPDGSDHASFPSEHASLAFTVATMEARFHPHEAWYWYGGATLIAASRVWMDKHYAHDVLAGAALGYGVSQLELSLPRGLILQPLIGERGEKGLMLSGRF